MNKILIIFYYLTTMKIRIIKKFHIRRTVKIGNGNRWFVFLLRGGEYIIEKYPVKNHIKQVKILKIGPRKLLGS